jgi:hypothetical protein
MVRYNNWIFWFYMAMVIKFDTQKGVGAVFTTCLTLVITYYGTQSYILKLQWWCLSVTGLSVLHNPITVSMAELCGLAGGSRGGGLFVRLTMVSHFNWRNETGPNSRIPRPGTSPNSWIPKTGTGPDWERAARQGRAGQGGRGPGRGFE